MFDLTPLTTAPLVWAALAFAVTYFGIQFIAAKKWLRAVTGKNQVYYAGAFLVALTILFVAWPLWDEPILLIGLVAAGCVVILGGIWDEVSSLRPLRQLMLQLAAAVCVVISGWTIRYISQPTGVGVVVFDPWIGGILAVAWLLLLMNAMNWLDGVDGLASGVGSIAFATLIAISLLPSVQDSLTLALALVGMACVAGFLWWNWPPARVYLGTSGSWWLGLFIGIVAIGGGGKIVTTLLVLALPVVDVLLVSASRFWARQPLWQGDRVHHLHYRLLRRGFSHRTITVMAMIVTAALGAGAIILQTEQKIVALASAGLLFLVTAAAVAILPVRERWPHPKLLGVALAAIIAIALIVFFAPKPCRNFNEGVVTIGEHTWSVAMADTPLEHSRGLMECPHLPASNGMYFVFSQPSTNPFWMKNMIIPLDIIWIQDNRIIGIEHNAPIAGDEPTPPQYHAPAPYTAVLEIPVGTATQKGLSIGQTVTLNNK